MLKRLLLSTAIVALAGAAYADPLFGPTVSVTVENSPLSASAVIPINAGFLPVGLAGVDLSISVVNAADFATTGREWLVFSYAVEGDGQPLSQSNQNWSVAQFITANVNVNFIGDFTQFIGVDGQPFNQTQHIFNQGFLNNPVPGGTGNGEGTLGFTAPFAAGLLPNLGAFADPFSIVTNALGTIDVLGFTQALEFGPQDFVPPPGAPEASTWAMGLMGFGLVAALGLRRARKDRLVTI